MGDGSPTRQSLVEELFARACELPASEVEGFLASECGDDGVRAAVRELLEHDAAVGDQFLSGSEAMGLHRPGDVIGRYRLERLLGTGGFGEVWLAEQRSPVRRPVALKIVKPGMDTRELIARFEVERQTLAVLDHPAIAKVFDAGATPRGRPYFVMEYVPGMPITRYCDERGLGVDGRLGLFLEVCAGVQHAHQKGVIHRDLKPSNLLMRTSEGGEAPPRPVIIDFGIAKTLESGMDAHGATMAATAAGVMLGTPEYMSPEQASPAGSKPDTRSDVYSLGVVLYELLVGSAPFRRTGTVAPDELRRRILEDVPVRPSSRVMDARSGDVGHIGDPGGGGNADARRWRTLRDRLRGDLDWIILKALEKDPARRYASAAEFAADVRRHLAHEPVMAGPPSVRYRVGKFIRRHRTVAASAAVITVMLVAATTVSTRLALSEAKQRRAAELNLGLAERRTAVASLAAAYGALTDENQSLALRNLELVPRELRGWEWEHLHRSADGSLYRLPAHDGVMGVVCDRGGEKFYTLDSRGLLRCWRLADGALVSSWTIEPGSQLFDVSTGLELGLGLAATWRENVAVVFEIAEGKEAREVWRMNGAGRPSLRPGTAQVVVTATDPSVPTPTPAPTPPTRLVIADVRTGETKSLPIAASLVRRQTTVDPSGTMVLMQDYADAVVLSLEDGRVLARPEARSGAWFGTRERPELSIQTGVRGMPDRLCRHEIGTGRVTPLEFGDVVPDASTTLSADGGAAVVGVSGRVKLMHAGMGEGTALARVPGRVMAMTFDPRGERLIVTGESGEVSVWDATYVPLNRASAQQAVATHLGAISPRAERVARAAWGDVTVWDAGTGAPVWRRYVSRGQGTAVAWSLDGTVVALATTRQELVLLDGASGRELDRTKLEFAARWLCVGARGERVFAGGPPGTCVELRREAGVAVRAWRATPVKLSHRGATSAGALTPDGTRLAVLGVRDKEQSGAVDVYDAGDLSPALWSHASGASGATALLFSRDGGTLWAACEGDNVLLALDAASGAETGRYVGGTAPLRAVAEHPPRSPDSANGRLAGIATDGTLTIWSTVTHDAMSVWSNPGAVSLRFDEKGETLVLTATERPVVLLETTRRVGRERLMALRGAVAAESLGANPLSETVVEALRTAAIAPEVREAALNYMARMGDSVNYCNSDAWRVGLMPDAAQADYAMGLRQVDAALKVFPDDWSAWNSRALVLLRLGRWDEAIADAKRSDDLVAAPPPPTPTPPTTTTPIPRPPRHEGAAVNPAIAAMAHEAAGRHAEAVKALEQMNAMLEEVPVTDAQSASIIDEARRRVAGEGASPGGR